MYQLVDKDEFNQMLDAVHMIQARQQELMRDKRLLSYAIPDEYFRKKFEEFMADDGSIKRTAAQEKTAQRIRELEERKEDIIRRMEMIFSDWSMNIRNYFAGEAGIKMTNPTSRKQYVVIPSDRKTALYYILLLERRVNERLDVCVSDYKDMRTYLRKSQSRYPRELFII